jgi:hypothetical protein
MSKRTRRLIVAGILIVLGGVLAAFTYNLSQPAQGVVTQPIQNTANADTTPSTAKGKTVTFEYPSTIQQVKADTLAVGDIEKFLFTRHQLQAWTMAIQIKKLPSGLLADDSAYNLRKQNPQQYAEESTTINGRQVVIMTYKTAAFSKTAFISHDGKLADISVSGGQADDTVSEQVLESVLNTWQWL